MTVTISEVISNFVDGRVGYESYGNLNSEWDQNNKVLRSYDAVIAAWAFNGDEAEIVIFEEWDGFSPTTTRHINELKRQIEENDVPHRFSEDNYGE